MKGLTHDTFFGGRLRVRQHRDGYRFSIDSILLAAFAHLRPRDRILDLGTGCGIIALAAAFSNPSVSVVGVEIQPALAALAKANAADNDLAERVSIVHGDLRRLGRAKIGRIDLVVANPPYRRCGSGRINPDGERAAARHEVLGSLADFIAAGRRLLDIGGRFAAVYPAQRTVDLLWGLRQAGLEPKRLRLVYPHPEAEADRMLLEAVKGAGPGLRVEPPLTVRRTASGPWHPEVAAIFEASP
jgi:tRNA1Val (adenine37-N6)-methyltransferase